MSAAARSGQIDHPGAGGRPAGAAGHVSGLFERVGSLMLGHVSGLFVCLVAMLRLGGPWPLRFTAASLALLAVRLVVLRCGTASHAASQGSRARLWLQLYQATGLAWSAVNAALVVFCVVVGGDPVARLLALVLAFGTTGGISSRNAAAPRFAVAQLLTWLLPLILACSLLGVHYWPVTLITTFYLATLVAIVRQHYRDVRSLVSAEQQSRHAQVALAAREADLQAIFNNAAAGVVEVDLTVPCLLRVNPVYCRMTGRSEADLIGRAAIDLSHPDDWPGELRWQALAEIGQQLHYERRYLHPDGTTVWARVSACVMSLTPDGRPARAVAIAQDCTAQKATEQALRSSEEMLRMSIDVGRIGSYQRDHVAHTFVCGRETRLMHGFPDGDAPLAAEIWQAMIVEEDRQRLFSELVACYAARREVEDFEYRFRHPVKGVRHIETRSRIIYDADGRPIRSIGVAIDVTERRQAEAQIAHLAHHDALTGLPNRILFAQRLDEALARAHRGEPFALVCLDLDRFKEINDTLGHPVGDALLRAVTARLQSVIRPTDTVARLGGDEFALIQTRLERPADATAFAARLLEALQEAFDLDGYHVAASASIGVAIAPADGVAAEALMRRADMALYAAKADGRGRFRLFERDMDADLQARRTLELDLRRALETQQFELFYQPVVAIATRTVCGFEALLRWHHPTRGLVPPDRFIPLAEATGLLVPIGAWVLRQACAEAARWPCGGRVAVNLSAVQFSGAPLVQTVRAALADSGLDPHRLELEITETAMLQDTEATLATLHDLKALGVTIAMDDFGTGYSSLSYLQRFPFDKVKIDRSFTTHLGDRRESAAIVGAVIDLCQSLEMRTTAEGVETECQFAALARAGCDEAQGFYFSPPRPAGEIPAMVERIAGLALAAAPAAE
jgi:diguanylate cyclase (GGDEF)-like protein/PAS domain S-box-containing protein